MSLLDIFQTANGDHQKGDPTMYNLTLATMRKCVLPGIMGLAIFTLPACAENGDAIPAANTEAPAAYSSESYAGSSGANAGGETSSAPALPPENKSYAQADIQQLTPPVQLHSRPSAVAGGAPPDLAPPLALSSGEGTDLMNNFGPSSGTVVGNRALELRDEVIRLRSSVNRDSNEFATQRGGGAAGAVQYHSTVAAITARLQNGTTKGNPILLRQWNEADTALNEVSTSMGRLNTLQTTVNSDASLAAYMLESIQAAFELSGAVDEDHDQLKLLRDEVSRLIVQLDYLRNQIANDIQRQTAYVTTERANLQALAFAISRGELVGGSLANRPVMVTPAPLHAPPVASPTLIQSSPVAPVTPAPMPPQQSSLLPGNPGPRPMSPSDYMRETAQTPPPPPPSSASAPDSPASTSAADAGLNPTMGHLLVLIRYNQPVVDYESQLSQAVGSALERRPNAQFSVVAVSPSSGDPASLAKQQENASRDAEGVKRSLVQLGLSPSRISMASTQTQNAQTPEVHVYIR
ncbi:MAG: hypothetical protein AB7H77_09025 [Bdellovibrionales bacterium]